MKKFNSLSFTLLFVFIAYSSHSQQSAQELLECACSYHDPEAVIFKKGVHLVLEEPREGQAPRMTTLDFLPNKSIYHIKQEKDGNTIEYNFSGDKLEILLNGSSAFSQSEQKKYRLTQARAELLKNYYYYLWYLPCNLIDDKDKLKETVKTVRFDKRDLLELQISYPEADDWYFYFDPASCALSGYKFHKPNSDGEYIYLKGEKRSGKLRIPAERHWFDNHDDQFLATDKLIEVAKYKKP